MSKTTCFGDIIWNFTVKQLRSGCCSKINKHKCINEVNVKDASNKFVVHYVYQSDGFTVNIAWIYWEKLHKQSAKCRLF